MLHSKPKGFTLIELLVVITILGIMATLVITRLENSQASARDARRKSNLQQIANALELYYSNYSTYTVVGTGYNSGGNGWFNYVGGTNYPKSVGQGLVDAGYFSGEAPRDPFQASEAAVAKKNGYYYAYMKYGLGQGFVLYADLERPSAADIASYNSNTTSGFGAIASPNIHGQYDMNYAVGHR